MLWTRIQERQCTPGMPGTGESRRAGLQIENYTLQLVRPRLQIKHQMGCGGSSVVEYLGFNHLEKQKKSCALERQTMWEPNTSWRIMSSRPALAIFLILSQNGKEKSVEDVPHC